MPQVSGLHETRNVDLQFVPDDLRLDMLRQSIKFKISKEVSSPGEYTNAYEVFEQALHKHTRMLFSLVLNDDQPNMFFSDHIEARIYFESRTDLDVFKKEFLLLHKLSN